MTHVIPLVVLASTTVGPPEENVNLMIGRRIRRRRRLMGMTQQELSTKLGVRPQQVQKYECSGSRVSAARLYALSSALKVPVTYFFSGLTDEAANDSEVSTSLPADLADEKSAQEMLETYTRLPERLRRNLRALAKNMQDELDEARRRMRAS